MAVSAPHAAFGHPGLGPSFSCESALSASTTSSASGDDIILVTPALLAAAAATGRCRHLPPVRMRADGTRYIRRQALRPWLDDDLIDQYIEYRTWSAASSLADTSSASLAASSSWTSSSSEAVEKPRGGARRPGRGHARARSAHAAAPAASTGKATRLARWWGQLSLILGCRQRPASAAPS